MSLSLNYELKNTSKIARISCMDEEGFSVFGKDCVRKNKLSPKT